MARMRWTRARMRCARALRSKLVYRNGGTHAAHGVRCAARSARARGGIQQQRLRVVPLPGGARGAQRGGARVHLPLLCTLHFALHAIYAPPLLLDRDHHL